MFNILRHNSSSLIGGETDFPDVNYSLFESEGGDHSDLALEAAKAKWKVCEAEKHLADCILEHQAILLNLWRSHVEAANCRLSNADLNVGHMHMERKKNGIAAFTLSDSGLVIIADNLLSELFIFVNNPSRIKILFILLVQWYYLQRARTAILTSLFDLEYYLYVTGPTWYWTGFLKTGCNSLSYGLATKVNQSLRVWSGLVYAKKGKKTGEGSIIQMWPRMGNIHQQKNGSKVRCMHVKIASEGPGLLCKSTFTDLEIVDVTQVSISIMGAVVGVILAGAIEGVGKAS
ncbi:hypothetical protein EV702DRAFT_1049975 [Suillus placidus]|uniref:Uncharacterized protein n=1 Tax=Suillus placidus TaxID=48579 RepID=A0A9P6ZJ60_9AGAM|nr:hypothetical protein EV702DRAFT_1049975 [Suillus placidus]